MSGFSGPPEQLFLNWEVFRRKTPFDSRRRRAKRQEGSFLRLIDFVSLNSRLASNKEEEKEEEEDQMAGLR